MKSHIIAGAIWGSPAKPRSRASLRMTEAEALEWLVRNASDMILKQRVGWASGYARRGVRPCNELRAPLLALKLARRRVP